MTTAAGARTMWRLFEPIHAVAYFAPGAREPLAEAGFRGFWRSYFAARLAPLGPIPAAPAIAVMYTFAPHMVERAVPGIWELGSPETAVRARAVGAGKALRELLDGEATREVEALLPDLEEVVSRADCVGRPLAAANQAVPLPDDPMERLWQLCTVLREHRGDGHLSALVLHGMGGCQALAWRSSVDLSRDVLQPARGWSDDEWDAAVTGLAARRLTDDTGAATPSGRDLLVEVERLTDEAAAAPWRVLDDARVTAVQARLGRIGAPLLPLLPAQNAIGLIPAL